MQLHSWPVETAPIGSVSMGTGLARRGGNLRVTVVVKAAFALVPGGIMAPLPPPELRDHEAHYADNPMRSIRAASDMMPFLELADVLFIGSANAPLGTPAPAVEVRLAVVRGSWALLDKALVVYGDRSSPGGDPKPFQRMPLIYERAYGGIGLGDNPLGVAVPNVVYPDPERQTEPAGFGPISWYWPARKRLLRGHPRQPLEQRVAEIPDGFDASFFQAAPEDQRIPFLHGDEIIVLENLSPSHAMLETRLPGARAMARVYTGGGMGKPFPLNADALIIEGDAGQCSVTWRGSFVVTGEEALASLYVAGGLEIGGAPIEWPTGVFSGGTHSSAAPPPRAALSALNPANIETVVITDEDATLKRPTKVAAPYGSDAPQGGLPAQGSALHLRGAPAASPPVGGTLVLSDRAAADAASTPAAPFRGSPPMPPRPAAGGARPPLPPSSSRPQKVPIGTVTLADDEAAAPKPVAAPFRIPEAGGASPAPALPIVGAPWTGTKAPPVPRPPASSRRGAMLTIDEEDRTLSQVISAAPMEEPELIDDFEDLVTTQRPPMPRALPPELEIEPEPEPAQAETPKVELPKVVDPPKAEPPKVAAKEPAKEEKPTWSWAQPPPEPARPPPPKPAPKPALKNQIYGSFGEPKKK